MTDTVKLLSNDEVAELQARPSTELGGYRRVLLRPRERDALCATVRALRADIDRFSTLADERHDLLSEERRFNDELRAERTGLWKLIEDAEKTNTALREQLAHAIGALKDVRRIVGAREIGADTESWIDEIIRKSEQP